MKTFLTLCGALAFLSLVPAPASAAPSFDCAKAGSKTEKAICADKKMSVADAEIARLYKSLRAAAAPATAALLTQDEKYFVSMRDETLGYGKPGDTGMLSDFLASRVTFLRRVGKPADGGLSGSWGNVTGDVTVTTKPDGTLEVQVETHEPSIARWVCEDTLDGRAVGSVMLVKKDDGSSVKVSRDGETLKLETIRPANQPEWVPDNCGHNGWIDGNYFAVRPTK